MKDRFDVFLCHNSEDKSEVKKVGSQLKEKGLRPWLDEWELRPGVSWQRLLEEYISKINAAAVFIGPSEIGPWQRLEMEAYLRDFVKRDCPVIPVILKGVSKLPKLPLFLGNLTWVDFRRNDPDPLEGLIWGITGQRLGSSGVTSKPTPAGRDDEERIIGQKDEQGQTTKWVIVLSATISDCDKAKAEAIVEHLRSLSGDSSLTLTAVKSGSMKLILVGSPKGFQRIKALFEEGKLSEILGIKVQLILEEARGKEDQFHSYRNTPNVLLINVGADIKEHLAKHFRDMYGSGFRWCEFSRVGEERRNPWVRLSPSQDDWQHQFHIIVFDTGSIFGDEKDKPSLMKILGNLEQATFPPKWFVFDFLKVLKHSGVLVLYPELESDAQIIVQAMQIGMERYVNQRPGIVYLSRVPEDWDVENANPAICVDKLWQSYKQQKDNWEYRTPSDAETSERRQKVKHDKVFIIYSHKDTKWLERLRIHLKPLEREGFVERWDDSRIRPGAKWREEIVNALNETKVAVLLVSAEFLACDFITGNELPPLLEAAQKEGVVILPVILTPSRFAETPLAQFQTVNSPDQPLVVMEQSAQEKVFVNVIENIQEKLNLPTLM